MTTVSYSWEYADPERRAPAEVVRLEAFLNTIDRHTFGAHAGKPEQRRDLLDSPAALRRWLAEHDLAGADSNVDQDAFDAALVLRDGLRGWLRARDQGAEPTEEITAARRVIAGIGLQADLAPQSVGLVPAGDGLAPVLGGLVSDLVLAQVSGTLQRVKICAAPDCLFVYYDHSRSRTSRWCSMQTCGNRMKLRRHRRRHR